MLWVRPTAGAEGRASIAGAVGRPNVGAVG